MTRTIMYQHPVTKQVITTPYVEEQATFYVVNLGTVDKAQLNIPKEWICETEFTGTRKPEVTLRGTDVAHLQRLLDYLWIEERADCEGELDGKDANEILNVNPRHIYYSLLKLKAAMQNGGTK